MAPTKYTERPAQSLSGPRVYSTDFHPSHFAAKPLSAGLELAILRSLKVKFLTKGTVTINGGHLLHPSVVGILRQNESILSDGLLLPARREDKATFGDYADDHAQQIREAGWSDVDLKTAVSFIEDRVKEILPWRVEQAVDAFRQRLLEGFQNPHSQIHRTLLRDGGLTEADLVRMIDEIGKLDLREDHSMERYIEQQPSHVQNFLRRYSHACYHVVGTTVVNCETGTDLAALSEVRINDLTGNAASRSDEVLSDVNIFHRCCFAMAMQIVNEAMVPVTFIDAIPFEKIASIRRALQDQGFQKKYDEIVSDFLSRIAAGNDFKSMEAWDINRTVRLVDELAMDFRRYLESEVVNYKTASQKAHESEAVWSFAETAKSGLHMVPVISELIAGVEMVKSYAAGIKHLRAAVLLRDDPKAAAEHVKHERARRAEDFLQVLDPSNKATILDALRELRRIAAHEIAPH